MTTGAGDSPVVLQLDGITKRFGTLIANAGISLTLRRGEVLALLGENGAGKTTLMNILFGHYVADEGRIEIAGKTLSPGKPGAALAAGVGMVHQHFTLAQQMTVLENVVLGTRPVGSFRLGLGAARKRLSELSADYGLAVDPNTRVNRLTIGQQQRVEILKALYRDARILILDEPTAVLTPQESEALFAMIRNAVAHGLSVIFISHKLHEVMTATDRVAVLRHGKLVAEVTTADTDRHKLAELMVGEEITPPAVPDAPLGPAIMRLQSATTDGAPGLDRASLSLNGGRITGIAGVSGNGQAALADLIGGLALPASGELLMDSTALSDWSPRAAVQSGIARIPEDRHATGTIGDFDLTENVMLETYSTQPFSRAGWLNKGVADQFARTTIADYDVRCPGPDVPIRLLSGGNMQKLILGRVLERDPRVILANQPTRGLDIGAVTYVHEKLLDARSRGAAVLLISEDLEEITALSDVIHVISEGRLSPPFARGEKTLAELGIWMAGQGFDHAA